ncbi:hypothetical protein N9W41_01315 [bacterium]|nr:hypothetical protein [bacterium]
MKKGLLLLAITITALIGYANNHDHTLCEGFVPQNEMRIPVSDTLGLNFTGLTEEQFNGVIDKVETVYAPIIEALGGTLKVNRKWDDATVNASAQRSGSTYIVNMYGGLARHEAVTEDGFMLVMCHELGHHIGGAPKIAGFFNKWASNEGQSDYFATMKCMRRVITELGDFKADVTDVDPIAAEQCADVFTSATEYEICTRGAMGGMSVAGLFQELRKEKKNPDFGTPDSKKTAKTNDRHPATQCRLDTYYQGAICNVHYNVDVDQKEANTGTCNRSNGDEFGIRPLCWYAPKNNDDDTSSPVVEALASLF